MPERKREKTLYDYNIYRILPEKAENFKSFLEDRKFEEIPLKPERIQNPSGYTFALMFCDKDNRKGLSKILCKVQTAIKQEQI